MYIVNKELWGKIHAFLLKSFRTSSSAMLDDGRMGIRVNAEPELFSQMIRHVVSENAESSEQDTLFEYVKEEESPICSEPEHTYTVNTELIPYIARVAKRYLYDGKKEGDVARINADGDVFSKIMARAHCEKRSKNEGVNFVTEEEASNRSYITVLFEDAPSFAVVPIHVAPSELFSENTVSRP